MGGQNRHVGVVVMRRISDERILAAGRELFRERCGDLTFHEFCRLSGISQSTVVARFGRWLLFKKRLGYGENRPKVLSGPTREELIQRLKNVAKQVGERVTLSEFQRQTGISATVVYSRFRSWTELREQAGLTPRMRTQKWFSKQALLADMCRLYLETRGLVTRRKYEWRGGVSLETVRRYFGSWDAAEEELVEFATEFVRTHSGKEGEEELARLAAPVRRT